MERIVYDRKKLEVLSIQNIKNQHPDWPREKCVEEGMLEENIDYVMRARLAADLADKMMESDGDCAPNEYFMRQAQWIVNNAPRELYKNINEYIDGEALSEIRLCGVSVSDVMNQFVPNRQISFVRAVECFAYWKNRNYQNPNYCRDFFLQ